MIKDFLEEHGSGFWLHGLGAIGIVLGFWLLFNLPFVGFVSSTALWVAREIEQHDGVKNIWTFHRILEWGTPFITGLLTWSLLS